MTSIAPSALVEAMRGALPHVPLAALPTPVQRLERLSERLGSDLWVKRDDLSGLPYGGNKVRKLEHLLAEARAAGARGVITFGGIGSNHVVATALYSRLLDLRCAAVVFPQPVSIHVRQNLLVNQAAGVRLHPIRSKYLVPTGGADLWTRLRLAEGRGFHLIAPGGSSPMGAAGMVTAGLELAAQVRAGELPEPDELFLPLGSMGTAAGIATGLALAGLRTRVNGVRVVDRFVTNAVLTRRLVSQTLALLKRRGLDLPPSKPEVNIRQGYFGKAYGHFTLAGQEALALLRRDEGLSLEGTYTAKAFACLLDDARQGALRGRTTLFWMTCNGHDLSDLAAQGDAALLPAAVRREFEKPDHEAG